MALASQHNSYTALYAALITAQNPPRIPMPDVQKPKKLNFSIESILGRNSDCEEEEDIEIDVCGVEEKEDKNENEKSSGDFSWLSCTRYKPPKLPRKCFFNQIMNN